MEPKLQSTFIPKGPAPHSIGTGIYTNRQESAGPTLLGIIGILLFVLAIAAAGGVFGYKYYLNSRIANMGTELEAARANLNPDLIHQIIAFDNRIISTRKILEKHTIVSPIFNYLEGATVQTVAFTEFNYQSGADGKAIVNLKGLAKSYQAVALQSDVFSGKATSTPAAKSPIFQNPIFSDLHLDDKGQVIFSFTADVDPSAISYAHFIQTQKLPPTTSTTTPAKTGTTTNATAH